jgi:hypothetical protein
MIKEGKFTTNTDSVENRIEIRTKPSIVIDKLRGEYEEKLEEIEDKKKFIKMPYIQEHLQDRIKRMEEEVEEFKEEAKEKLRKIIEKLQEVI